ncbi:MAG: DNA polymerase III subunit gamma/tau [Magnetococcales bacterium]|nr:DNA polymerase III subunit gamma/tau [Magnetococcales bacterium]
MSSYVVLARKWRPHLFDGLVGQPHVVQTLSNALHSGRLPHAFLFTGIRGVGKTTLARLLALCMNCHVGISARPCQQCPSCLEILAGKHPDVLEVDAASRTKVDQMRDILDTVRYTPALSRFKIYILDEVHMLTTQSFNALLKTLEEPPQHVKFIFATTEARKIPATILSRCQRHDLKRLTRAELIDHFSHILTTEQIPFEVAALELIARQADGSVRDGLSLLDQAIVHGDGKVHWQSVHTLLGLTDRHGVIAILQSLLQGDTAAILRDAALFYQDGVEPVALINHLLELLHELTLLHAIPTASGTPEQQPLMELVATTSPEQLQMIYQVLLRTTQDVRQADLPWQALEMALLRVAHLRPIPNMDDLIERLLGTPEQKKTLITGNRAKNWGELVATIEQQADQSALALKLRQQLTCLDFRWLDRHDGAGPSLSLRLQLTNDCFATPRRLQQTLTESLQKIGYDRCHVVVQAAAAPTSSCDPPPQRPETLQEATERQQATVQQQLEQQVRDHSVVQAVQKLFNAEIIRCVAK